MNVLYMACNVDTRTEWIYRDYEFYWNKEDAEKHAEFLERCNQLYRDEYDPAYDIFDIGQDTHEARVYSVPYFGTGHPENEAPSFELTQRTTVLCNSPESSLTMLGKAK